MSDTPDTLTPARQRMLDLAQPLVGLAYPDQCYLDAIAPGETPARQTQMGLESGCALLLRSLLAALLGITLDPYEDEHAFSDVWKLAGGTPWPPGGAVLAPRMPFTGDAVVYDKGPGGPVHVDAVWLGDGKAIAGGQRNGKGQEMIAEVERLLEWIDGHLVDRHTGRPVMAIISPDMVRAPG